MTESMLSDTPLLTAEEFAGLPEDGWEWTELVRGEVVREPPPVSGHGLVVGNVAFHLRRFVQHHRPGHVFVESGCVVERGPDTVRGPDVSFVASGPEGKRWRRQSYLEGAPDLAVEVVSPGNTRREMLRKAAEYLAAGARQVWILDPEGRTVTVHARGRAPRTLTAADRLDGGDLLPGFSLPVLRLFEE